MTLGLSAVRRLAFAIAALLLITLSPITSSATADSRNAYASLGHAWLSLDSNLLAPSHISAWAIDDYLARNTPLPALGHAFKQAEARYGVNALYLLAHAMHETAFGTSYIGQSYHNLFGWNAADRDPTGLATRFRTFAVGVDYVASQIAEQYLSPFGRFYGGAATLRGMRYYASDPMWGILIARIANGIVLPTLARRGVAFGRPVIGDASTGQTADATIATKAGDLPDGLEAAYRFVPVAIVEAGSPTGSIPAADPAFRLADGHSSNGAFRLTVDLPKRAGRYRLEMEVRDSDGTELTEFGVPRVPDAAVRVFGSDAVAYDLAQDGDGLTITVSNEGRRVIPTSGRVAGGAAGAAPTTVPTTLTAWTVDDQGTAVLLSKSLLDKTLKPGGTWTAQIPQPDAATLPAILVVRLDVGGEPGRLGGSPPGVFHLAAVPGATPASTPAPTASIDPTAANSNGAAASGSLLPSPPASGPPVALSVAALTPTDPATRTLLNPGWKPATLTATANAAGSKTLATTSKSPAAGKAPVIRLSYLAIVKPKNPGFATIRVTNSGTAPLLSGASDATADLSRPTSASPLSSAEEAGAPTGPVLLVTAVPAWGPATEPVNLAVPILIDVAAGASLDLTIALPASPAGQSSYLVLARVVAGSDQPAYPATMFWLRSAPPSAAVQANGSAPSITPLVVPATKTRAAKRAASTGFSLSPNPATERGPTASASPSVDRLAPPWTTPPTGPIAAPAPDRTTAVNLFGASGVLAASRGAGSSVIPPGANP